MQHLEVPETPILQGEDAVKALNEYIAELKMEENPMDDKQRTVMLKLAEGLIRSVKAEIIAQRSSDEPDPTELKREKKARFLHYFTHSEAPKFSTTPRVRERFPLL